MQGVRAEQVSATAPLDFEVSSVFRRADKGARRTEELRVRRRAKEKSSEALGGLWGADLLLERTVFTESITESFKGMRHAVPLTCFLIQGPLRDGFREADPRFFVEVVGH